LTTPWAIFVEISRRRYAKQVIDALAQGPQRFTDLSTQLTLENERAIHPNSLSNTLRWAIQVDLVTREDASYALTDRGRAVLRALEEITRISRPEPPTA
jgi:DNA-binding HxlR family transcriptional regulator